jgi:hypothetical protein
MRNIDLYYAIKCDYENGRTVDEIAKSYNISKPMIHRSLMGVTGKGIGKSNLYLKNCNRHIPTETELEIINDYNLNQPIPYILEKYNIDRYRLLYIRTKYQISDRNTKRFVDNKSITVQHGGQIITYPHIEAATKHTGISREYLRNLKLGQNFANNKAANKDVFIVWDVNRIQALENACELMGHILTGGTTRENVDKGVQLKQLIYELGYAEETEVELNNQFE